MIGALFTRKTFGLQDTDGGCRPMLGGDAYCVWSNCSLDVWSECARPCAIDAAIEPAKHDDFTMITRWPLDVQVQANLNNEFRCQLEQSHTRNEIIENNIEQHDSNLFLLQYRVGHKKPSPHSPTCQLIMFFKSNVHLKQITHVEI